MNSDSLAALGKYLSISHVNSARQIQFVVNFHQKNQSTQIKLRSHQQNLNSPSIASQPPQWERRPARRLATSNEQLGCGGSELAVKGQRDGLEGGAKGGDLP